MSTLRLQRMRYKVMLVQIATALLSPPQSPPELSTYVAKEVNTGIRKTRICMNLSVGRTQVQRRLDVRFESMQCHVKLNQVGKLMSLRVATTMAQLQRFLPYRHIELLQ